MGYFKKRREIKEEIRKAEVLGAIFDQAKITGTIVQAEVAKALRKVDSKKLEYEDNVRENLEEMINDGSIIKLVEEVADVIDKQAQVYSYRIAKGKRTELAQDILVALSVKK